MSALIDERLSTLFAQAWETAHRETLERPQRARANARAWVGIVWLDCMYKSERYRHSADSKNRMYRDSPDMTVVPAAPNIFLNEFGCTVWFKAAGKPFRFHKDHLRAVRRLGGLKPEKVPGEPSMRQTVFPDDRVCIQWTPGLTTRIFRGIVPKAPFTTLLIRPGDEAPVEIPDISGCRIFAVFLTKAAATRWAKKTAAHFRNQKRQK